MKIYRFVPDPRGYRTFLPGISQRWWPEGISMPEPAPKLFPRAQQWQFEGNRFGGYPTFWPISDFPHYHLCLPAWSPRAHQVLRDMIGIEESTNAYFSEHPFTVVRPTFLPDAVDLSRSRAVTLPSGAVLALKTRWFREDAVTADIFWAGPFLPYPDVYLSERFVQTATAAELTGIKLFKPVWDDGRPIGPPGPPRQLDNEALDWPSLKIEFNLLFMRAELEGEMPEVSEACTLELAREGWIGAF